VKDVDPKRFFGKRRPRYWTQNIAMKYLAFSDSIRPAPTVNWRGRLSVLCSIVASNWTQFPRFLSLYQWVKVTARRKLGLNLPKDTA
jgi:hypothetical protein